MTCDLKGCDRGVMAFFSGRPRRGSRSLRSYRLIFLWAVVVACPCFHAEAQGIKLRLPDSLRAGGSREFSGMTIDRDRVLVVAENRSDKFKANTQGVYSFSLEALRRSISDSTEVLNSYRKYLLTGIEHVMSGIPGYQGLEAIAVSHGRFYACVETDEDVPDGYLITGSMDDHSFRIDTTKMLALPKPPKKDGSHIFNAGFESLCMTDQGLYVFYEFNYFRENYAYLVDSSLTAIRRIKISRKIPFRLTDTALLAPDRILAINYFFPLEAEKDYWQGLKKRERRWVRNSSGYHPYARLVRLKLGKRAIKVGKATQLPPEWWGSNWEALAVIDDGVLLMNDKYAVPVRESQLLFLPFRQLSLKP